jgi:anti-sigma factor (TIGR02949 family)
MTHEHHEHGELSCEEVMEQLFTYLDGELGEGAHIAIDRHLEACRACYSRIEFERRLKARLAETRRVSAPESLRERVRAMIARF